MTNINKYTAYRSGKHAKFISAENGCRHEGCNPNQNWIRQFQVDGQIFTHGTQPLRCDWLILNDDTQKAFYIELKGSDIAHAIEQIESTINEFKQSIPNYKTACRIIYRSSNSHQIHSQAVIRFKRKYRDIEIRRTQLSENL